MHNQHQQQPTEEECVGSVYNAIAEEVHWTDRWKNWLSVMQPSVHCTLLCPFLKEAHIRELQNAMVTAKKMAHLILNSFYSSLGVMLSMFVNY
jgi:hypothetical protein